MNLEIPRESYLLGVPTMVPSFCTCCGGAEDSIISIFTQLHIGQAST